MENRYLLDTSALINIKDKINIDEFAKQEKVQLFITQLTPFEFGNVIWKFYNRGIISRDEAVIELDYFEKLLDLKILNIINFEKRLEALKVAIELKISYYDAAYIATAKHNNLILITDDNGIITDSKSIKVKAINSTNFINMHKDLFNKI